VEQVSLLRDFALIMVVAGIVTIVLRKLRQPPVLGYLVAGLFLSPYFIHFYSVTDVHTIGLLADIGLVLLLFGVGLEFGWSKIRQIGITALIIGGIEIVTMISLGYGLGRLLGWSKPDALFLGAALHTSSSAIIVKILKDMGKLNLVSSRVIVGILVVEDFAAVIILSLLSGINTPAIANLGSIISLLLKLVIFVASSLALGAIVVPRIIAYTRRFQSRETLLIVSLALCFALALISKELGLSVATGAFLMGALMGDAKHSEEIADVTAPVRDMFAAIFFVAIGMLIDISKFKDFLLPAVIVAGVFIIGKILSNFVGAVITGYTARNSLQVGMGMPQMGEFSLAVAKVGVDSNVTVAPLYPVIAIATSITTVIAPYLARSADKVADFLGRHSPNLLRQYVNHINDWGQTIRQSFLRQTEESRKIRQTVRIILVNFLILAVIIGIGTFALQYVEFLASRLPIRLDIVALLLGSFMLVLCLPSLFLVWRNLMTLIDEITRQVLNHSPSARIWKGERLKGVLRHTITIFMAVLILLWMIPLISQLLFIGSTALAIPALLLALAFYLVVRSIRGVHHQLERTFSQVFLGESQISSDEKIIFPASRPGFIRRQIRKTRLLWSRLRHRGRSGKSPDSQPDTKESGADRH
jgi:monovalent cation:H+ antiporter-2, CPA2 family